MKIVYTITGMYNSGGMERVLANKANYLSHAKGVDGKSNKVIIIIMKMMHSYPSLSGCLLQKKRKLYTECV